MKKIEISLLLRYCELKLELLMENQVEFKDRYIVINKNFLSPELLSSICPGLVAHGLWARNEVVIRECRKIVGTGVVSATGVLLGTSWLDRKLFIMYVIKVPIFQDCIECLISSTAHAKIWRKHLIDLIVLCFITEFGQVGSSFAHLYLIFCFCDDYICKFLIFFSFPEAE